MAGELREVVVNEVDNKEATPAASLVGPVAKMVDDSAGILAGAMVAEGDLRVEATEALAAVTTEVEARGAWAAEVGSTVESKEAATVGLVEEKMAVDMEAVTGA